MGNKDEMPFPPKKLQIRSFFNLKKALETKERKAILSKMMYCAMFRGTEKIIIAFFHGVHLRQQVR